MKIDLTGKRAVVSGGSRGIGEAIVKQLAACGAKVAFSYRSNEEGGQQTLAEMEEGGGTGLLYPLSVGCRESVAEFFQEVDDQWGGVDIVVNNAGMDGKRERLWEIPAEDWERVIEVDLIGTYYMAAEGLRRMVQQGEGVFLAISSVHEQVPWGGHTAYTAAKAGVGMMMKSLSLELAETGVRAVSLAPGAIKTEINQDVWSDPETMADLKKKIPMNRMGTVQEVAETAAYLVSEKASYITGTTVFADGGMASYASFAKGG